MRSQSLTTGVLPQAIHGNDHIQHSTNEHSASGFTPCVSEDANCRRQS